MTDKDIPTFHFYPCANTGLTGGVVNEPTVQFGALTDAYVGQAYTLTFTVDAVFGVQELRASLNGTDLACTEAAGVYTLKSPPPPWQGRASRWWYRGRIPEMWRLLPRPTSL
ncbi:MAG: hypothetical protein ACLSHU_01940 [Oscillospiraceae bacterium]